jgi:hypothetical protein
VDLITTLGSETDGGAQLAAFNAWLAQQSCPIAQRLLKPLVAAIDSLIEPPGFQAGALALLATATSGDKCEALLQNAWTRIRHLQGDDAAAALGFIITLLHVLPPSAQSDTRMLVLITVTDPFQQRMLWHGIDTLQCN